MKDDGQKQDHANLTELRSVRISKIKDFKPKPYVKHLHF